MRTVLDGLGGVKSVIQLNSDGSLTTGTVQDCSPILEYAKARHNEGKTGSSEMRLAASIPHVVIEEYCRLNGIGFDECIQSKEHSRRILNDPSLAGFRIWKGRV